MGCKNDKNLSFGLFEKDKRLLQLGPFILTQLFFNPQLLLEEQFSKFAAKTEMKIDGELMPIPLNSVINDPAHAFKELGFEVRQVKGQVRSRIHYSFRRLPPRAGGRQRRLHARRFQLHAWWLCVMTVLNRMFLSQLNPSRQDRPNYADESADLSRSTRVAIGKLFGRLQTFFAKEEPTLGVGGFPTLSNVLDRIDLGERYSTSVCKAENLDASRLKFPKRAGVVDLDGIIFDEESWISNPALLMKDEPIRCRKARVWCEEEEWKHVVQAGLKCGLFKLLDKSLVAKDSFGNPILNGAFGVQKSGETPDGVPLQRFIANLIFNDFVDWSKVGPTFRNPKLPYPSQLTLLTVREGEALIIWSDDEDGCFNIYALPEAWYPFLCFQLEYEGQYVALSVLPMGFVLSVGIIQVVERHVAQLAGLNSDLEVLPDRTFPRYRNNSIYQIYIDNFDEFRVVSKEQLEFLRGSVGEAQAKLRATKARLGIPLHTTKALEGCTEAMVLGAAFEDCIVGVSCLKRQLIALAWLWAFFGARTSRDLNYGELASLLGASSHAFLFNRGLFSTLSSSTYRWLNNFVGGTYLPPGVMSELLAGAILLPLAQSDLSRDFDSRIWASDASPYGGAFGSAPCSRDVQTEILRHADTRGTAVRVKPRPSVDDTPADDARISFLTEFPVVDFALPLYFTFHSQFLWKHPSDIVILEGNAFVLEVRHFLKDPENHGKRVIHLFDAASALGGFAKGRSSSKRLNRLIRKTSSLCLLSDTQHFFGWCDSGSMPMDLPSRRFPLSSNYALTRWVNPILFHESQAKT